MFAQRFQWQIRVKLEKTLSAGAGTTDAVRLAQPVCLVNNSTRRFPTAYCSHYDLNTAATFCSGLSSACQLNFEKILSANIKIIALVPMSMTRVTKSEGDNSADY